MQKKIRLKSLIVVTIVFAVFLWIFTLATTLTFVSIPVWFTGTPKVHFSASWNDFLWTLLIDSIEILSTWQVITLSWVSKTCNKQLHWLYYNSARWNRVWPLDQSALDQLKEINPNYSGNLTVKGWLFTECTNSDTWSIFGYVEHVWTKNWHTMDYYLMAWVWLDYATNKYKKVFANNIQVFDVTQGISFLWFIRDNYGWIWLAWWPSSLEYWTDNLINFLNWTGTIKTAFTYSWNSITSNNRNLIDWRKFKLEYLELGGTNFFWNLFVRGTVWISNSYKDTNTISTTTQSEALLFNLSDTNVSTLVNTARQKASTLCRDRWTWSSILPASSNASILCYKNTNLTIDMVADKNKYWNKTIVLNSGNVFLKKSMESDFNSLELFLDKWILLLEKPVLNLESFNQNWYVDGAANFKANFLKWVFIVNWLIIWTWVGGNNIFPHKLLIHGKVTSLNSPEPTQKRKDQVFNLLWAWYEDLIDLDNIFTWTCSYGWTGSDATRCEWTWDAVTKPFVLIDKLDNSMKYKLLNY